MAGYGRGKAKRVKRFRRFRKKMFRKMRKYGSAPRQWYPLGRTQSARLRYVETIVLNPEAGVCGDYIFKANGMYDANYSGGGHQPYGFDQMMVFYKNWTVIGSKITIKLAGTQVSEYWAGVTLRATDANLGGQYLTQLLESPEHHLRMIYNNSDAHLMKGSNIGCKFSAKKFFTAKTSALISDAQYQGDKNKDPDTGAYYHVILCPANTGDLVSQPITVIIDYYAIFTKPITLTTS